MGMLEVDVLRQKITDLSTGREWKGMGTGKADDVKTANAIHREAQRLAFEEAAKIVGEWRGSHWTATEGCACDQCRIELHATTQVEKLLRVRAAELAGKENPA